MTKTNEDVLIQESFVPCSLFDNRPIANLTKTVEVICDSHNPLSEVYEGRSSSVNRSHTGHAGHGIRKTNEEK